MDIADYKIKESDLVGKGVSAQSNPMELPEEQAKAVFDQIAKEIIIPRYNAFLDAFVQEMNEKVDKVLKTGSQTEYKVLSDNNFADGDKTALQANTNARHGHTNKSILDNIKQADVNAWHGHSNKSLLDDLDQTDIDNWNGGNVLTKDNTRPFTPTGDYHPATKKFVDDLMVAIGAGDMQRSVYDPQGKAVDVFQYVDGKTPFDIGAMPRRNLLDNPRFKVNQRGQSSVTSSTYQKFTDRWKIASGTGTVVENGASFVKKDGVNRVSIEQIIIKPELVGKECTLSALIDGEIHRVTYIIKGEDRYELDSYVSEYIVFSSFSYADGKIYIYIRFEDTNTHTIEGVKLEEGEGQTLAYQDADGNWQLYDDYDYTADLLECQRYFFYTGGQTSGTVFYVTKYSSFVIAQVPIPVEMVSVPTGSIDNASAIINGVGKVITISQILMRKSYVIIVFECSEGTAGSSYPVTATSGLALSSEL